jgi:predicted glutamine amidotransferase
MCLISVIPQGVEKNIRNISRYIIQGMKTNTDGSGFMYKKSNANTIGVKKGYFNAERMIRDISDLNLTSNDHLILHHRLGTQGDNSDENTHPFVISDNHLEIIATDVVTDKPCMVHNGIFYDISEYVKLNPKFSDTYAFTRYVLAVNGMLDMAYDNSKLFDKLTKNIIGSDKICILHPEKGILLIGSYIKVDGCYHSNNGFRQHVWDRGGHEINKSFDKALREISM